VPNFVIEFNRRTRERRVTEYGGSTGPRDAMLRRLELEAERSDTDVEIVALTSDSLEALMRTHSRYFTGRDLVSH